MEKTTGKTAPRTHLSSEPFSDQPTNRRAQRLYKEAVAWLMENGEVWAEWVAHVRKCVAEHKLWSAQELAENYRRSGLVASAGGAFVINNNHLPALARIMCERVPGAEALTELRSSTFERAFLERTSE